MLPLLAACEDDFPVNEFVIGEGESLVSASVSFEAFGSTDLSSRAAGNAMKDIKTLYVLRYNAEEELIEKKKIDSFHCSLENNNRPSVEEEDKDGNVVTLPSAETKTPVATFQMKIPYGKYHMYVVANIDIDKEWGDSTAYDTVDKLLAQRVRWEENVTDGKGAVTTDNTKLNAQMFGYFSKDNRAVGLRSTELVVVNAPDAPLKAWIKRVASKVTVAFDTRKLYDNIYIYIKSVSIKDIPKESYIGLDNTPKYNYDKSDGLIETGETFYFGGADASQTDAKANYTKWRELTNGDSIYGYFSEINNGSIDPVTYDTPEKRLAAQHAEDVPALYFYENMQGTGESKKQDADGDGIADSPFPEDGKPDTGWKDGKSAGTYVEVDAYYISLDSIRPGRGPMKYRFMMGKDTDKDYNAERNRHYKLTLAFKGHANDIDWHVDYEEEAKPGFLTPDTVYVSYLYNQHHTFAARATPRPGYRLKEVRAVILQNEWRPHDAPAELLLYNNVAWDLQMNSKDYYSNPRYDTAPGDTDYPSSENVDSPTRNAPNCEFGWLSLREVTSVYVDLQDGHTKLQQTVTNARKKYFDAVEGETAGSKGKRTYDKIPTAETSDVGETEYDALDGNYTVHYSVNKHNGEKNYILTLPLYTRAKTIGAWAVYSGANPFYEHRRKALVRYTAYYEPDGTIPSLESYNESSYTVVMQAYRIDNPRGIFRKHDSREPFNVTLKHVLLHPVDSIEFSDLESRGAWSAEISKDPYGLVRLTKGSQVAMGEGNKITGKTGTTVSFTYTPNRVVGPDDAIGAIITVRYHNNSCIHKIIVRQGYGPVQFDNTGKVWSSFNVYDKNNLTKSPLSVGSLFRRYSNLDYPIAESNNETYGLGENLYDKATKTVGKLKVLGHDKPMEWNEIKYIGSGTTTAFGSFTMSNGHTYTLPTANEIRTNIIDNNSINFAFGISYADGARETLSTAAARTFSDPDNTGKPSRKGVRGVIAYCLKHGDNIFFPFGATGHARRKNREWYFIGTSLYQKPGHGLLRYGSLDIKLAGEDGAPRAFDNYRPLAYNLPAQRGGAYWVKSGNKMAIDFNGGNYMVADLGTDDLYGGWNHDDEGKSVSGIAATPDALPIRPVRTN